MTRKMKPASHSAQLSLKDTYGALKAKQEENARTAARRSRVLNTDLQEIVRRLKNGESTGDPIVDFFLKTDGCIDDRTFQSTKDLFTRVAQHPGEFFFLENRATVMERGGEGVAGPQSRTQEFCLFGRLSDQPCEMEKDTEYLVQHPVRVPTQTFVKVDNSEYIGWQARPGRATEGKPCDFVRIHNHQTTDPHAWFMVGGNLQRTLRSFDFDMPPSSPYYESRLAIGDTAVLSTFGITARADEKTGGPIGITLKERNELLKFMWLATRIGDAMDRSDLLKETAVLARKKILERMNHVLKVIQTEKGHPGFALNDQARQDLAENIRVLAYYGLSSEACAIEMASLLASVSRSP